MRRFVLTATLIGVFAPCAFAQQSQPAVITIPADAVDKLPIEASVRLAPSQPDLRVMINQARGAQAPTPAPVPIPQAQPVPPAPPAPPPPPAPRELPSQNVRLDVTITDTFGSGPTKKTVTVLVADGRLGFIRSSMSVALQTSPTPIAQGGMYTYQNISLNIDAQPTVLADGRVFAALTVAYTPDTPQEPGGSKKPGSLNESIQVVLTNGRPTLLSQSADPQGDRRVTLEVTATVVK